MYSMMTPLAACNKTTEEEKVITEIDPKKIISNENVTRLITE